MLERLKFRPVIRLLECILPTRFTDGIRIARDIALADRAALCRHDARNQGNQLLDLIIVERTPF